MQNKNKRNKRLTIEFFTIVFTLVGIFLIVGGFGLASYLKTSQKSQLASNEIETEETQYTKPTQEEEESTEEETTEVKEEEKTINIAVFGLDKDETRTDVIFVANFNTVTKKINIVSVPRDTRVKLSNHGYVKLNEVHAYNGVEASIKKLEEILNIEINNYVKVNLKGFKNIVDALGGVEMNVPQAMNYDDPEQDLHIHLSAGYQKLDGKKAEQLVRYRSYAQADLKRIEVQHLFMKALIEKVLNMDNLIRKAPQLAYNLIKYVKTDVGLDDILDYVKYIDDIKPENISMVTIAGEPQTIDKKSYFIYNQSQAQNLLNGALDEINEEESSDND